MEKQLLADLKQKYMPYLQWPVIPEHILLSFKLDTEKFKKQFPNWDKTLQV